MLKGEGWRRGSPPPADWGPGVSLGNFLENCLKMVHSGANFKTENLYEKNCVCLRKDIIHVLDLEIIRYLDYFLTLLLYLNRKCCTKIQLHEY